MTTACKISFEVGFHYPNGTKVINNTMYCRYQYLPMGGCLDADKHVFVQ